MLQDLGPSLFNANIHIRNQHVLKCRKNIKFGCGGGGGARWGSSAHGLIVWGQVIYKLIERNETPSPSS